MVAITYRQAPGGDRNGPHPSGHNWQTDCLTMRAPKEAEAQREYEL